MPSASSPVPESWNRKSVEKVCIPTGESQKALPAWLVPPSVSCSRVSSAFTALPFSVSPATEANPLLKLIVGGAPIVYFAIATLLLLYPLATPIASTVVVLLIGIAPLYRFEAVVGSVPSVV